MDFYACKFKFCGDYEKKTGYNHLNRSEICSKKIEFRFKCLEVICYSLFI